MAPLHDSDFCWAHDERYREEAAEAGAGGQVKKREGTLALLYDLNGLGTVDDIRRWIEFAMFQMVNLDNSVMRDRGILSGAQTAAKLLEVGELADRLAAVEGVLARQGEGPAPFSAADGRDEEEAEQ